MTGPPPASARRHRQRRRLCWSPLPTSARNNPKPIIRAARPSASRGAWLTAAGTSFPNVRLKRSTSLACASGSRLRRHSWRGRRPARRRERRGCAGRWRPAAAYAAACRRYRSRSASMFRARTFPLTETRQPAPWRPAFAPRGPSLHRSRRSGPTPRCFSAPPDCPDSRAAGRN